MSELIVDYYDQVAVIQTHSLRMHLSLDRIVGLKAALPELQGIYDKSKKFCESQLKPMLKTDLLMVHFPS